MNEMTTTRDWYNRLSGVYDSLADSSERPARVQGLKLLSPQPGERILELGFGTGQGIVALAHAVGPTGEVYGVELADRMKEVAEQRVKTEGVSAWVKLTVGDARQLKFATGIFDGVFASFTLELFDETSIAQVLCEARRVLKPGGRIALVSLAKEDSPGVGSRIYERLHQWFPTYIDCHPIELEAAVRKAGFKLGTVEEFSLWGIAGRALVAGVAS